jgi:hypothetical protein
VGQRVRTADHAEIPELRLWLVGSAWLAGFYRDFCIPGRFAYSDHGVYAEPFLPTHRLASCLRRLEILPVLTGTLIQAIDPHDHGSWRLRDNLQLIRRQASATVRGHHACSFRCRLLCHLHSPMGFGPQILSLRSLWEIRQFRGLDIDRGSLHRRPVGGFCCVHRKLNRHGINHGMH